jgi:mannose-6-phosphate isomerase
MWHILRAEPGAQIAAGFRAPITPLQLRESALSGEIEDLLQWHDAAPGDTFFIPAGTVHAIGPGLTLCEIQQQSDVTYRLYDYGRPRELHLDRAAEVSHLGPHEARQKSESEVLVRSPYFTTSRLCISNTTHVFPVAGVHMVIVTDGLGTMNGHAFRAGEVWYLEANIREIVISGTVTILVAQA